MSKEANGKTCGSCRFYDRRSESTDPIEFGACRRYPPMWFVTDDETISDHPQTDSDGWCGEWKPLQ